MLTKFWLSFVIGRMVLKLDVPHFALIRLKAEEIQFANQNEEMAYKMIINAPNPSEPALQEIVLKTLL